MYSKDKLLLAELPYTSIQGEGKHVGKPMTYVRTQGCNVNCSWCDSYYTWYPYGQNAKTKAVGHNELAVNFDQLKSIIEQEYCQHVWFTGGEPMLQADAINNFIQKLNGLGKTTYICTAGTIFHEALFSHLDYITVDIKAPFSKTSSNIIVIEKLYAMFKEKLELKMVVAPTDIDMDYAKAIADRFTDVDLTLQPLYVSEPELYEDPSLSADKSYWDLPKFADWINEWARHYDNVRMGTQMHKYIWPEKTRLI